MDYNEFLNRFFRESSAAGLKKLDKKFSISLDNAFKDNSNGVAINCSDIKKKPSSKPLEFEKTRDEVRENFNEIDLFEVFDRERKQNRQKHIARYMHGIRTHARMG